MDPVVTLKRTFPVDFKLCIFCQTKSGKLCNPREEGMKRVKEATDTRRKSRDSTSVSRDVVDRLTDVFSSDSTPSLVWHKTCYIEYTHKEKLARLTEKDSEQDEITASEASSSSKGSHKQMHTRHNVKRLNWKLCIFCQEHLQKTHLSSVMTFPLSNEILTEAKLDHRLSICLAGISDLMAAEAKYHLHCLTAFRRKIVKTKAACKDNNLPMVWLCTELRYAAEKGQVINLDDVWERYVTLVEVSNGKVPLSYLSRRSTFKEKLEYELQDCIVFVQQKGGPSERKTLLFPSKFTNDALAQYASVSDEDDRLTMPTYEPEEDIFLSLVHVALKIRGDLVEIMPSQKGFQISNDKVEACIPDSLFMFLRLVYGGSKQLEEEVEGDETILMRRITSTAQDIIYGVSGGSKLMPKHIGLASSLHQATRSKDLVELFHKAGHTISYDQVLQLDTALAEHTLECMNQDTGSVIPPNLQPDKFVHFTADNIDIQDETLDGKLTFHATQVAAWQRGPASDVVLNNLAPSKSRVLKVPDAMETLASANMPAQKPHPNFPGQVEESLFQEMASDTASTKKARATDMAFNIIHQRSQTQATSWTVFNEKHTSNDPPLTTVGYMPIIQAPAHEYDTLLTVVNRCMDISAHINQEYTVLTVDQALYWKLMELKWAFPDKLNNLIPRLGGLHIAMNFLKVIGQHMRGSGLVEVWVEAGILGEGPAELAMAGKAYSKAMRAHKLTWQALWGLICPALMDYVATTDNDLHTKISAAASSTSGEVETLVTQLNSPEFDTVLKDFAEARSEENVNFSFWWGYMELVQVLLLFTRAQRDGIWDLHLHSFRRMLPMLLRYDHYNYGRWGPVYLTDMSMLPASVLTEFQDGNFVVKRSSRRFNQVDPDQAQEWLNGTGKRGGGIVGITKTSSALSRWALSYNLRSQISAATYEMFNVFPIDTVHNEARPGRQKRDVEDEQSLGAVLQRFQVFESSQSTSLQSIATKDLSSETIQDSLLNAVQYGEEQLDTFVKERLLTQPGKPAEKTLYDTINRNNAPTFETLYQVVKESKEKGLKEIIQVDRKVLQRLLAAYVAGRKVDLDSILKHELMPVPVCLANMDGSLRSGNKAALGEILTAEIECPEKLDLKGKSAFLVIDGQARVVAIGKPAGAKTFGDLADVFIKSILMSGESYDRIDVVFDRYRAESIKGGTRKRRAKRTRPVRRIIESRDVPLPNSWGNFIALAENKADLARFLSEQLLANAPPEKEIVLAGGFLDEQEAKSSHAATNVSQLQSNHEEADTRLALHAINVHFNTVVVSARDTDVLLLLISHFPEMNCDHLWMMAGTSKKKKYIPIDDVYEKLPAGSSDALLPFHALTGTDTTSYFCNHGKKTAWNVFREHHDLLNDLGDGVLTQTMISSAEKFVCRMYGMDVDSVDAARSIMFQKGCDQKALPPTSDALHFHIKRAHYQSMVWKRAHCPVQRLPDPTEMGWKRVDTRLVPKLMTLDPIPDACMEIIYCSCRTGCSTQRCKCNHGVLSCTACCKCKQNLAQYASCLNPRNRMTVTLND